MSKLMTVLVVLLSLAVAGLFLVKHKNASLRASLDRANNVASQKRGVVFMERDFSAERSAVEQIVSRSV